MNAKIMVSLLSIFLSSCFVGAASNQNSSYVEGELLEPGKLEVLLHWQELERRFLITIPPEFDSSQPSGVLFAFHGGGGSSENMVNLGFEQLSANTNDLLIYPAAADGRWNDGRSENRATQAGIDDVGFVVAILDWLEERISLDRSRVGAAGVSNGGMFTYRLGCEKSELFSTLGVVIASMPMALLEGCEVRGENRPAFRAIQGTVDEFITFEGGDASHDRYPRLGEGGAIISAYDSRDFWADALRCEGAPLREILPQVGEPDGTEGRVYTYEGCDFQFYVVEGMGHTWPPFPGVAPRLSGPSSNQINATELIWEAFRASQ